MPGADDYIRGTDHSTALSKAMEGFHRALTRRWRELVCDAVVGDTYDFPTRIRREVSPHNSQPLWDFRSLPARHHINGGQCAYVAWVQGRQKESLASVSCDGSTGVEEDGIVLYDPRSSTAVEMPRSIECGVGSILAQVEDWAWAERDTIFYRLPMFDHHNVPAIERAHNDLVRIGAGLGMQAASGSGEGVHALFADAPDANDLTQNVESLSGRGGVGVDWWAGWTGLMASRARSGFFASVAPTLYYQTRILGLLANLYSERAAIIEKGRNDGLRWIEWATDLLDATEQVTTDLRTAWKVVQGIGGGIAVGFAWTGAGPVVGAAVSLVGFLGENLAPQVTTERTAATIEEVVGGLNDEIENLNTDLARAEFDYYVAVSQLRTAIFGVHSFNLELYDLTANSDDGDRTPEDVPENNRGFSADVDSIVQIAKACYEVGERYEGLLPIMARTSEADRHLAGRDGRPTDGDRVLLELRDQVEGFLKTTWGRYLLAGDQVREAAEAYVEVDTSQQGRFGRTSGALNEFDTDIDLDRYAQSTDRGDYDPYDRHPALSGRGPGADDGEDYLTEEDPQYVPDAERAE